MEWEQVNAWRMRQQHLDQRVEPSGLLEVVSRMNGLHAQLMSAAELQVWARADGITSELIQQALWQTRTLVKTWMWRGTLHIVSAQDFPLFIAGRTTIKSFRRNSWLNYHGVTLDELDALMTGVRDVLTDQRITRDQFADQLAAHTGNPKLAELLRSGWGALLKPSASRGDLCFGENIGQNVTFVNPRHWLGERETAWTPVSSDDAMQMIALRFLRIFAPAPVDEFARWFGFEPSDAKKIFKALDKQGLISEIEIGNWRGWVLTDALSDMEQGSLSQTVRLLPHFDPYTLAVAKHCDYLMPNAADHQKRVYRPQGWISPVVLFGGRIVGVWEQETKRGQTLVTLEAFEPLSAVIQEGIEAEVQRLAAFLGMPTQVIYA